MNTKSTAHCQTNLLTAIRTHPGKTAQEYADICLLGELTVQNQLQHLLRENLVVSPSTVIDKETGEKRCIYAPTVRLPEVVHSKQWLQDRVDKMQKVIDALAKDNERLRAELLEAKKK